MQVNEVWKCTLTYLKFSRKFMKWKIYFGPLVLAALKCYFGVSGHKIPTSFKTLVSKNSSTWSLHQTSG